MCEIQRRVSIKFQRRLIIFNPVRTIYSILDESIGAEPQHATVIIVHIIFATRVKVATDTEAFHALLAL